jgi:hypothetical protein
MKSDPMLRGKDSIELVFSVKNCSKDKLILYNLAEPVEADQFEESFYCNPNITAGITLFIYDANSEMMWPDIEYADSIAVRPQLDDWFIKLANKARSEFHKNMRVANADHSIELKSTVGLKRFHLKKGTYSLMLIYFAGENISNLVSADQMNADQRKHNAKIYQGCARSNKVTLVVE